MSEVSVRIYHWDEMLKDGTLIVNTRCCGAAVCIFPHGEVCFLNQFYHGCKYCGGEDQKLPSFGPSIFHWELYTGEHGKRTGTAKVSYDAETDTWTHHWPTMPDVQDMIAEQIERRWEDNIFTQEEAILVNALELQNIPDPSAEGHLRFVAHCYVFSNPHIDQSEWNTSREVFGDPITDELA